MMGTNKKEVREIWKSDRKQPKHSPPLDYQLMTILCVSHTYPLLSHPAVGEEKIIV